VNFERLKKLSFKELQSARRGLDEKPGSPRLPVSVLLDDIRSLHNVGSIFRTSDAVYVEKLYLCGITGTPPRNEIRKTSLGAEESVPWSFFENPLEVTRLLKNQGYRLVALEQTNGSINYRAASYSFPLCLILGHEYRGIRDELIEACDMAIDIPMHGLKTSLNVSVSFGVVIYHIRSWWEQNG
jgi:tRNA G18 (ribose-2'-O)-methylase SpoU